MRRRFRTSRGREGAEFVWRRRRCWCLTRGPPLPANCLSGNCRGSSFWGVSSLGATSLGGSSLLGVSSLGADPRLRFFGGGVSSLSESDVSMSVEDVRTDDVGVDVGDPSDDRNFFRRCAKGSRISFSKTSRLGSPIFMENLEFL